MKLYRYLYYRLYSWNLRTWGEEDLPQWNALFGVSFMMYLNLMFLLLSLRVLDINLLWGEEIPKVEIIITGLVLLIFNYLQFIKHRKYETIGKEFKDETQGQRLKKALLLWLYVLTSFGLIIMGALFF